MATQKNLVENQDAEPAEPPRDLELAGDRVDPNTGTELATLDTQLEQLDVAIDKYAIGKLGTAGTFSHAFKLARGMNEIERLITDEMMMTIMPLMNTRLGFKTDKDPTRWNKRLNDGKGGFDKPYPMPVVKKVLIEAILRGAYPVNNEFNIIASSPYLTKEFYQRNVKGFPGLTDLDEQYSMPRRIDKDTVAIDAIATWKLNGIQQRMERVGVNAIAIIADDWSNADQSQGKAARKLLYAIYRRLTGSESSTDLDPNDPDVIDATMRQEALGQDVDDVQRHPENDHQQDSPEGRGSEIDPWAMLESRYMACMTQKDAAAVTARFKQEQPDIAASSVDRLKTLHEVHQKRLRPAGKK